MPAPQHASFSLLIYYRLAVAAADDDDGNGDGNGNAGNSGGGAITIIIEWHCSVSLTLLCNTTSATTSVLIHTDTHTRLSLTDLVLTECLSVWGTQTEKEEKE